MRRRTRWIRRLVKTTLACLLLASVGLGYQWRRMSQQDIEYAEFCKCGDSVGDLLKQYAKEMKKAAQSQDASKLSSFFASDYQSANRGKWLLDKPVGLSSAKVFALVRHGDQSFDRERVLAELQNYVDGIQQVDEVVCKIDAMEEAEPPNRAVLKVKYVLNGEDRGGLHFQDRFFFRWTVEKRTEASGISDWRVVRDELIEGVRVAGRGNAFQRAAPDACGIHYVHRRDPKLNKLEPANGLKFSVMEHVPGGVSAVDYDDDGRTDLFFADGLQCRLYRNATESGSQIKFQDVTSSCGLDGIDQATSALFFDVDNDGDKDLFVACYMAPCKLLRNDGNGHFESVSSQAGVDFVAPVVSACTFDYDRDGLLDLYVGSYGNAFLHTPNITFNATNGQPNRLLRNVDGKRFVDVTRQTGTGGTAWTLAVTAGDYDRDGFPDLAVANDLGRKVLYHNNGDGTFTDRTKEAGVSDFSGGMGVVFADLDGDTYPDLLTANIDSGQKWFGEEISVRQYLQNVVRTKWILEDLDEFREVYTMLGDDWRRLGVDFGDGNSIFSNNRDGTFSEWKDCKARRAGWTWGIQALDYDNDADLDIYVANGWISGKRQDDL